MAMSMNRHTRHLLAAAVAFATLLAGARAMAQAPPLTFTATATAKRPGGPGGSRPITIRIDRFATEAERDALAVVVKSRQPGATLKALAGKPDIGYIQLGEKRTPIKYAYARSTGDGRLVTVVTAQPIFFLEDPKAAAPKPKAGFELALALLVLDGRDTGEGELSPAAKIRMDDKGAIVTEEYGDEVVRLVKISRVN
jgi:hypothetical protein